LSREKSTSGLETSPPRLVIVLIVEKKLKRIPKLSIFKKMKPRIQFHVQIFLFLCAITAASCSNRNADARKKPVIAVSILPQAWFVKQLLPFEGAVDLITLAGAGQNPHLFEPSPQQLAAMAGAGVWVLSGAEFEISLRPKIEKTFLKKISIVDGTEGVHFRRLEPDEIDEDEKIEGNNIDRHTWLGREPAKILAFHIKNALLSLDAKNAEAYERNYEKLIVQIDEEFARLREELAPLRGKSVFVYHPAFGYFLDEFQIKQEAVETGGKEPGPRALNALIEKALRERPAALFVQAQFPLESAKTVALAAHAETITLDPLAEDWLENIKIMGEALKKGAGNNAPSY
jgi:zinc transport system substrate-binding protein